MKHSITVHYEVSVKGRIWSGHKASMDYTFDYEPTRADILIAGDFETISRYRVERVTTVTCTDRTLASHGVNIK